MNSARLSRPSVRAGLKTSFGFGEKRLQLAWAHRSREILDRVKGGVDGCAHEAVELRPRPGQVEVGLEASLPHLGAMHGSRQHIGVRGRSRVAPPLGARQILGSRCHCCVRGPSLALGHQHLSVGASH